jgi:putative addiction module component (TIGR02574 family)
MTPRLNELLPELLALPEADRAELAERLLESLDGEGEPDDPAEVDAEWADEIARRLEDYRAGRVTPIPWEEVRRRMQAELDKDAG